jgi:endogenous inhibitor of DNA gyrase (YacG/DUF329 family)
VDLGNWLTGQYTIPGPPVPQDPEDLPPDYDSDGT